MKEIGFENLHQHSFFSLLDGFADPKELAIRSKEIGQHYLCITDHGMMAAIPSQIRECEKITNSGHKLSPIYGIELYLQDKHCSKEEMEKMSPEDKKEIRKSYHLLAIAKNLTGYTNLVQLSSWAWINGFYYKPRVTWEQLRKHKEGIIFTSCCYNGEIGQAFERGLADGTSEERAEEMLKKYIHEFGNNFYLELMLLDFKKQKPYDAWLIKMHDKYGVPLEIANDCHYAYPEDSKYQRYMLMIQKGSTIADIENAQQGDDAMDIFELQDKNLWRKSEKEINEKWKLDYKDIIPLELFESAKLNTIKICEMCKGVEIDRESKLPRLPDEGIRFIEALESGMKWRGVFGKKAYMKRIEEEYNLITKKGFSSYFLIQKMFTDEARRKSPEIVGFGTGHEAIGPGRGCFDKNTLVPTVNGAKFIDDISTNDLVYSKNGDLQKVEKVYEYNYDGEMIEIKNFYGDNVHPTTLTPDHMVWCEKMIRPKNWNVWAESTKKARKSINEPSGDFKWIPASEVEVGDWLWYPKIKIEESELKDIDLSEYIDIKTMTYDENNVYQYVSNSTDENKTKSCERYLNQDEDWFKILGLFVGDGWLRSRHDGAVGFCFHSENNLESFEFVREYFASKGVQVSYKKHDKKKLIQLWVLSRYYHNLFRSTFNDYVNTSQSKYIPPFVISAKENLRMAFVKGYFLSDGHLDAHKIKFTTCSQRLAYQSKHLLNTLNIPASISKATRVDSRSGVICYEYSIRIPSIKEVSNKQFSRQYMFRTNENGMWLRVKEIKKVNGVKKVYDISTPSSESFITSSFAVHNSGVGSLCNYVLGITDVDPLKHGLLFSRFMSESRGGKTLKTRFTQPPLPLNPILEDQK